jgi:hypothetical protein
MINVAIGVGLGVKVGVDVAGGNKARSAYISGREKNDSSKCSDSYPAASTINVIRSVSWKKTGVKE